ncbi:MAG: hypothetical protein ACRCV0_06020, partial [Brevinema sp.]
MHLEWIINIIDILVTSITIYLIYYFFKGTYTGTVVKGMIFGILSYSTVKFFKLETISWLFERFFNDLPLIVVILFHQEIKQFLSNLGRTLNKEKVHTAFVSLLSQSLLILS